MFSEARVILFTGGRANPPPPLEADPSAGGRPPLLEADPTGTDIDGTRWSAHGIATKIVGSGGRTCWVCYCNGFENRWLRTIYHLQIIWWENRKFQQR